MTLQNLEGHSPLVASNGITEVHHALFLSVVTSIQERYPIPDEQYHGPSTQRNGIPTILTLYPIP